MIKSPWPSWSDARFKSFIVSALRSASNKFPPKYSAKKAAWLSRGVYQCAGYNRKPHKVTASIKVGKKRVNNVAIDHRIPVVGPEGFQTWDVFIERLFCSKDNLQILCRQCHSDKSKSEREKRKK